MLHKSGLSGECQSRCATVLRGWGGSAARGTHQAGVVCGSRMAFRGRCGLILSSRKLSPSPPHWGRIQGVRARARGRAGSRHATITQFRTCA